jgi:hypothetical protein
VLKFSCCRGRVARHAERLATPVSSVVNKTLKCYLLCLLTSSFDFVQPNLLHHSHIAIIRALIYGEIAKRGCFQGYLLLTAK